MATNPTQLSPTMPPQQLAQPTQQLTQERVLLSDVANAFARTDANGRIPIVVLPRRVFDASTTLALTAGAVLFGGIALDFVLKTGFLPGIAVLAGGILAAVAIMRALNVIVPEGLYALLARGGRHRQTLTSGFYIVRPFTMVSHFVTRREIPFDVPLIQAWMQDDVRAEVDALVTFGITDPAKFVYQISATDFDLVFQAACQEALRAQMRTIPSSQLGKMIGQDDATICAAIERRVETYGVTVRRLLITFALPPQEFLASQEAKQLAVLQQAEQVEKQILAEQRQGEADALTLQKALAVAEREREVLIAEAARVEEQRRVVMQRDSVEAERLGRLQARLQDFPQAVQLEMEYARLEVARSLASNSRAILQVGSANDIAGALVLRDAMREPFATDAPPESDVPPEAATPATNGVAADMKAPI